MVVRAGVRDRLDRAAKELDDEERVERLAPVNAGDAIKARRINVGRSHDLANRRRINAEDVRAEVTKRRRPHTHTHTHTSSSSASSLTSDEQTLILHTNTPSELHIGALRRHETVREREREREKQTEHW